MLIHEELPLTRDRDSLSTYLAVLKSAIENWSLRGSNLIFACGNETPTEKHALLLKRKLFVSFPRDSQDLVKSILAESSSS